VSKKYIRRAAPDGLVPDGRDFDLPIPPMEVRNWPQEWENQLPGGHTKRAPGSVSELIRHLVALMKDKNEPR
jgi:hypothetical protein